MRCLSCVVIKSVTSFTVNKNDSGSIPERALVHGPISDFIVLSTSLFMDEKGSSPVAADSATSPLIVNQDMYG